MASDDAVAAMARTILAEKRARKVAEDDALRLYNRVRQLQKEEDRAQKRIVETKKKAKEIIRARERNEQKLIEKEHRQRELQEQVEDQKLDNLRAKEEALRHRIDQENKIYQDKLEVVQKTKEERAEIERLLAESRLLARKEALEQKDFIRKQQEDARRKIETLKLQKLTAVSFATVQPAPHVPCVNRCDAYRPHFAHPSQAQEEYERRLKEEIDAKLAKEQEIERLVRTWAVGRNTGPRWCTPSRSSYVSRDIYGSASISFKLNDLVVRPSPFIWHSWSRYMLSTSTSPSWGVRYISAGIT